MLSFFHKKRIPSLSSNFSLGNRINQFIYRRLYISKDNKIDEVKRETEKLLTVSLIGRPNTGKSTLFNRIVGRRQAIVSNIPGTTRDRSEGLGYLAGLPVKVIDTGGLDIRGVVNDSIRKQVESALLDSDLVLFLLDGRAGVTALDQSFASWLRSMIQKLSEKRQTRSSIPTRILVVANKTEGAHQSDKIMDVVADSYALGLSKIDPILISATHGDGMSDLAAEFIKAAEEHGLKDPVRDELKLAEKVVNHSIDLEDGREVARSDKDISVDDKLIQLAIMGRPNVGKSTLLNAIVGEERVIAGPTPGLTRDAIHVEWNFKNRKFRLVDTAGLTRLQTNKQLLDGVIDRKNQSIAESLGHFVSNPNLPPVVLPGISDLKIEDDPSQFSAQISEYALLSALNALRFAQVVVLVVEATQGKFSKLDLQLARRCLEEGRGVFIAANKFDLLSEKGITPKQYEQQVMAHTEEYFREFGSIPVVACSGELSKGVDNILRTAMRVHDSWDKRIDTWILNQWLKELLVSAPNARVGDKNIRIKYMTQVKARPPTFALFTNVLELPPFFERFLRSRIQQEFGLKGVPVRFVIRKSEGREVKKHLLKQGKHSRRGTGIGEAKGRVGPNRKAKAIASRIKSGKMDHTEKRRRRDTRLRRQRSS